MLIPELYAAPQNLILEQVHLYVRHGTYVFLPSSGFCSFIAVTVMPLDSSGERTPVGPRMTGPPANITSVWPFCNIARQFSASVIGEHKRRDSLEVLRVTERRDAQSSDGEWCATCSGGSFDELIPRWIAYMGSSPTKVVALL